MYYPSTGKLAEAFPPGDMLQEKLEEMGMPSEEFASLCGLPVSVIDDVLGARIPVGKELAEIFEKALGIPVELWLAYQRGYEAFMADRAAAKKVVRRPARRPRRAKHETIPA